MGVADVNGIDAIRELRASDSFEATLTILTAAIGKVERLPAMDDAQRSRLCGASVRLANEYVRRAEE